MGDMTKANKADVKYGVSQVTPSTYHISLFVETLLEANANIAARDENGNTPLHLAALNGHPRTVEALLKAGANPKAKTIKGQMPYDLAKDNEKIRETQIFWVLNDARFED